MKTFFKLFGWIFLGIFLQFKFNVLYGIVFLENLNFHDRTYFIKMDLVDTDESLRILKYIPENFKVMNHPPYLAAEPIEGYQAYRMNMKRKYRDVLSRLDFIIVPVAEADIPSKPVIVHFENLKQLLHKDNTYQLSAKKRHTILEGPEVVEAKYPQQFGM